MPKIAIVAALEREVHPLIRDWSSTQRQHDGRKFRFFENDRCVLICGGIGASAARRASEAMITLFQPSTIYSAGFAGGLDPSLKVGDIVRPARIVDAADGSSAMLSHGDGVLVSFQSIASPTQKSKLRESFGALAVDMEAAAVARAAEQNGIRFQVLKIISDESHFELPALDRFVNSEGKFSQRQFVLFAAIRPWIWPQVFQLAHNSGKASRVLCSALRDVTG
jgi:adenosylhomocysteine nucleosidase